LQQIPYLFEVAETTVFGSETFLSEAKYLLDILSF